MYPVNQVIVGGNTDPFMSSVDDIDMQIQKFEAYKRKLQEYKAKQNPKLTWDYIDDEVNSLSDAQKNRLFKNQEYAETANLIQGMVDAEIVNLVKAKIENTPRGKELLQKQLDNVRRLKDGIINETNREIALFNKFREFSKTNPNTTYEEFIKSNM